MKIETWHADSLAGPMGEMKKAFEAKNTGLTVNLTSGRSKELAELILRGAVCDVFAASDPAVIRSLFGKQLDGRPVASWYVVFSANELVVITPRGNPLGIRMMKDLAGEGVVLARVAGERIWRRPVRLNSSNARRLRREGRNGPRESSTRPSKKTPFQTF